MSESGAGVCTDVLLELEQAVIEQAAKIHRRERAER